MSAHDMTAREMVAPLPDAEITGHDQQRGGMDTALLGMMLFIASEVMFFAALFAAYFYAKGTQAIWPPEGYEHILNPWPIAVVATTILIISSFTMQWGTNRIRKGDRTGLNRAVAITLALGVIFLGIQLYDYYELITVEQFTIDSGVYGTLFYTMTGFHGAHVLGGVIGLVVILSRGLAGQFTQRHHVAVEAVHYYWHFVDVVWVLLFAVLYLIK